MRREDKHRFGDLAVCRYGLRITIRSTARSDLRNTGNLINTYVHQCLSLSCQAGKRPISERNWLERNKLGFDILDFDTFKELFKSSSRYISE